MYSNVNVCGCLVLYLVDYDRVCLLVYGTESNRLLWVSHLLYQLFIYLSTFEFVGRRYVFLVELRGVEIQNSKKTTIGSGENPLESFFPYDPYLLRESSKFIDPLYVYWEDIVDKDEHYMRSIEQEQCFLVSRSKQWFGRVEWLWYWSWVIDHLWILISAVLCGDAGISACSCVTV